MDQKGTARYKFELDSPAIKESKNEPEDIFEKH